MLFGVYQLWGTGIRHAYEQRRLRADLVTVVAPPTTITPGAQAPAPPTEPPRAAVGALIGEIEIPSLGLRQAVVEGVDSDQLRSGPGRYPHSASPGHLGNAAFAGHRTTYGGPFARLDELRRGDAIVVRTAEGTFRYAMTEARVVAPSDTSVVFPTDDSRLTLTTCHPKFSARQRLVVVAALQGPSVEELRVAAGRAVAPAPPPRRPAPPTALDGADRHGASALDALLVLSGAATAVVGLAWLLAFRRRRHFTTWVLGALPFGLLLFVLFTQIEQVLPPNF